MPSDAVIDPAPTDALPPTLGDKLRFLRTAGAYPGLGQPPDCLETHMSWLFFTGDEVLKLKKPVRFPFLDFATLASREFNCREELRLNARLAPGVYLGLMVLQAGPGGLALRPAERPLAGAVTVDWLVRMRRLPAAHDLGSLIASRQAQPPAIDRLAALLAAFYRRAPSVALAPADYLGRYQREQAADREVLLRPQFHLQHAAEALARLEGALARGAPALQARAAGGCIVDGHGDLRPEHVWLLDPPVVIDCLEFNAALRQVDPYDELAFLAMECGLAGADWIGPRLLETCTALLGDAPPPALLHLYTAHRALLRARLAMAHLLDPQPRTPERWPMQAARYIGRALAALDEWEALGQADAVKPETPPGSP